jgi:hypothetical protein
LWRNQDTNERSIEAIIAVEKESMLKPGTKRLVAQRRSTFTKMAKSPKVRSVIGRAII